ncbi:MAG: hypothetical protein QOD83_4526 [Solirubrobacteraceae bacterium]|jgi:hypothetical protein|nr:hypothetical protein [Solirubrobacteraceae bacterium]
MAPRETQLSEQPQSAVPRALSAQPVLAPTLAVAAAIGNREMARLARIAAPRAGAPTHRGTTLRASVPALRMLAREGDGGVDGATTTLDPLDGGLPPGGASDGGIYDAGIPPAAGVEQQFHPSPATASPASTPPPVATPAPPDRDTIVRDAINQVLSGYQNLTVTIPATMPPAPGHHATPAAPPAAPSAGGAPTAPPPPPAPVTFSSPYYINRPSGGAAGGGGGPHGLGAPGVGAWFSALPGDVRVGKGSSAELQEAMQHAVERGLLNATWPPTSASVVAFMKGVGLGVDCSGFVYRALMAADAALTAAGMAGLTSPQTTSVTNTSSQQIGRGGGTAITSPGDLRVGDIIQMAPNASNAVGHIRIITSVRAGPAFVEYDTAESTTRVGDGPQASTWRLPVAGPMDTSHLEVRNSAGAWGSEPSGRPSTYWRRLAVPAPAPAVPAPAPASPAGGASPAARALARCVARRRSATPARATDGRPLARAAPRSGGWNADDRDVTGTWRIQVTGLTQGLASDDRNPATAEETQHRAIAIVPKSIVEPNLEVLVHLHGNNIGERERTSRSDSGMAKGTVRDVEGDLIPQQVAASARNLVAIVPQGTVSGGSLSRKFAIADPRAYVTEVLAQVVTHVNRLDPTKSLRSLAPVRIEVSGHSGGGPAAVGAASAMQASAQATDQEWLSSAPLLLFDAINGPGELNIVTALAQQWLNDDKRRLLAHADPADASALLDRRGLKLRSTYTSGVYEVTNSRRPPRTYHYPPRPPVTIAAELSLEAKLDHWFSSNSSALGTLAPVLRRQYVVERMSGSHDFTVGTGSLPTGARAPVAGVTQAPGAPAGSNEAPTQAGGNLERALGMLSPADRVGVSSPAPAGGSAAPAASSAGPPEAR